MVFEREPRLGAIRRKLEKAGASVAMMSGSGSAVFGLFRDREGARRAVETVGEAKAFPISLVGRARYRSLWTGALASHIKDRTVWPPRNR